MRSGSGSEMRSVSDYQSGRTPRVGFRMRHDVEAPSLQIIFEVEVAPHCFLLRFE